MGFAMEGQQTDDVWGVVDTVPETDFPDIRVGAIINSNEGNCITVPREDDMVSQFAFLFLPTTTNQLPAGAFLRTNV
jgi:hypothetical protein